MYTTKLDESKLTKEQRAFAARTEREILRGGKKNNKGRSGGGRFGVGPADVGEDDLDEEDRFSGVRRFKPKPASSDNEVSASAAPAVPPGFVKANSSGKTDTLAVRTSAEHTHHVLRLSLV